MKALLWLRALVFAALYVSLSVAFLDLSKADESSRKSEKVTPPRGWLAKDQLSPQYQKELRNCPIDSHFIVPQGLRVGCVAKTDYARIGKVEFVEGLVWLEAPQHMIKAGTKLSDSDFQRIAWPKQAVPPGAVEGYGSLVGLYAVEDLPPFKPITAKQVSSQVP